VLIPAPHDERRRTRTPLSLAHCSCCLLPAYQPLIHWGALRAQVDVTEIFRQIPHEKKVRMVSLLVYLVTFVVTIYKCAACSPLVCPSHVQRVLCTDEGNALPGSPMPWKGRLQCRHNSCCYHDYCLLVLVCA